MWMLKSFKEEWQTANMAGEILPQIIWKFKLAHMGFKVKRD